MSFIEFTKMFNYFLVFMIIVIALVMALVYVLKSGVLRNVNPRVEKVLVWLPTLFLIWSWYSGNIKNSKTKAESNLPQVSSVFNLNKDSSLKREIPPRHGETQYYTTEKQLAPFTINTPTTGANYYYIVLKDASTKRRIVSMFVYGGSSHKIMVPLGNYLVQYASGNDWYGYANLFGSQTQYTECVDSMNFYFDGSNYMGHIVSLIPQTAGNLRTERMSPSEF